MPAQLFILYRTYSSLVGSLALPVAAMVQVVTIEDVRRGAFGWFWMRRQNGCPCGRYAFYHECGHLPTSPILHKCGGTLSQGSGGIILCYRPAPLVNVHNVVIRGQCSHCRNNNNNNNHRWGH
ncbi:hypothetical protein B0T26DRAFT_675170 [Lasiosphaeria miniovina]|uniref:Uncharacterized protein n=1 Tax=Lasiosphaeria miniovina TaxID=1954250 RepID=A0AA40E5W8_9PEZI|nr:uncharacterized protein B0T26DRAFT_675170 [Lasiosphaeria miniovina]KAK0723618.1 hypothetical protein B0T26DRAFT_675170 [Lasiosphaeria miniovina]